MLEKGIRVSSTVKKIYVWSDLTQEDIDRMKRLESPYAPYSPEAVRRAVDQKPWQQFRESLKRLTTSEKLRQLENDWIIHWPYDPVARIQVDNYLNALRRAGLLPAKGVF